ncbi:glycosyltransferase family A protein [Shimia biformata]|uniref:glycosyltransferase family A protein n=1 Tax=Shimia biformata TaxID=1294299 RepID=UPI00195257C1|nr:glycosyltransferase family A protein [Shimia biformata]
MPDNVRYSISLTSIPTRFAYLPQTVASLLAQDPAPDTVTVYLPRHYRRFPDYDGTLPDLPEGASVTVIEEDLGPATKLLPALAERRGTRSEILFCDDDRIYPPGWSARFAKARRAHPDAAIALAGRRFASRSLANGHRTPTPCAKWRKRWQDPHYLFTDLRWHLSGKPGPEPTRREVSRAGYCDIFLGYGGVLVRPEFFGDLSGGAPAPCFVVDDIWLSAELTRAGTPIWVFDNAYEPVHTSAHRTDALFLSRFMGMARPDSNMACVRHYQDTYGIW